MKPTRREIVAGAGVVALIAASPAGAQTGVAPSRSDPKPQTGQRSEFLKIGAGGFIMGGDISDDGLTHVIWCDTYGAYLYDNANAKWIGITTPQSFGSAFTPHVNYDSRANVWQIVLSPSNNNRFYAWMAFNNTPGMHCMWRSDNRGATWTRCNPDQLSVNKTDAQGGNKKVQNKIAVDPYDADVVIAGCSYTSTLQKGAYITTDAGVTWTKILSVPDPSAVDGNKPGVAGIVFDKSGGQVTIDGKARCRNVYLGSAGNGIYRSTDGGQTFSLVPGSAGLETWGAQVDNTGGTYNGTVWFQAQGQKQTWRYFNGSLVRVLFEIDGGLGKFDDLPSGSACPSKTTSGDVIFVSTEQGASAFTTSRTFDNGSTFVNSGPPNRKQQTDATYWKTESSSDIPYLEVVAPGGVGAFFASASAIRHPTKQDRYILYNGVGVWYCDYVRKNSEWYTPRRYYSMSKGIEQLVAHDLCHPPSAPEPVCAFADRNVMCPSPNYATDCWPRTFALGAAVDWASNDPSVVVANVGYFDTSYVSVSKGYGQPGTWGFVPTQPAVHEFGGCIAAASSTNWLYVGSQFGHVAARLQYTTDGGKTWTVSTGFPTEMQWPQDHLTNAHLLAADRVNIGTFYVYLNKFGLFRSTNNGATFTLQSSAVKTDIFYNGGVVALSGVAGFALLATSGNALYRTTNGGANLSAIRGTGAGSNVCVGAAMPGGDPRVFFEGAVGGVLGMWYTDNITAGTPTWTAIATGQAWFELLGSYCFIRCISGNMNDPSILYCGLNGEGVRKIIVSA